MTPKQSDAFWRLRAKYANHEEVQRIVSTLPMHPTEEMLEKAGRLDMHTETVSGYLAAFGFGGFVTMAKLVRAELQKRNPTR